MRLCDSVNPSSWKPPRTGSTWLSIISTAASKDSDSQPHYSNVFLHQAVGLSTRSTTQCRRWHSAASRFPAAACATRPPPPPPLTTRTPSAIRTSPALSLHGYTYPPRKTTLLFLRLYDRTRDTTSHHLHTTSQGANGTTYDPPNLRS